MTGTAPMGVVGLDPDSRWTAVVLRYGDADTHSQVQMDERAQRCQSDEGSRGS